MIVTPLDGTVSGSKHPDERHVSQLPCTNAIERPWSYGHMAGMKKGLSGNEGTHTNLTVLRAATELANVFSVLPEFTVPFRLKSAREFPDFELSSGKDAAGDSPDSADEPAIGKTIFSRFLHELSSTVRLHNCSACRSFLVFGRARPGTKPVSTVFPGKAWEAHAVVPKSQPGRTHGHVPTPEVRPTRSKHR